jgi:hypothetical protein
VHYVLISQKRPVQLPNGLPYENTIECWNSLIRSSNDARYLDLVPAEAFVDRRNSQPLLYLSSDSQPATLHITFNEPFIEATDTSAMPYLPTLKCTAPTIAQLYHVELWCEKTTVNDVLERLAVRYDLNVVTGAGELSQTACVRLVERAAESGRPVRILYISDFDPAGQSMPVAVARKIQHRLLLRKVAADIQVRPIALTAEQCEQYRLPRTPIKETDRRKGGFEERHGGGATELDALEAIHPGELERIIKREIGRYYDATLADRVRERKAEIDRAVGAINARSHRRFRTQIEALQDEWGAIATEHEHRLADWRERAEPVWRAISDEIDEQALNPDEIDWPEPIAGDEDNDPLFDSTRDYIEQVDRFKDYQGKPIRRRNGGGP